MTASADSPHVQVSPRLPVIRDKTLVAWVAPANHDQQGGSVLTIEANDAFDAVVFGERRPDVWMAGSEMFKRTEADQSAYPTETASPTEFVRVAAVYRGDVITLYRNDRTIASYKTAHPPSVFGSGASILIGLRHMARRGEPNSYFNGVVEEARIYDRALSAEEIAGLRLDSTAGVKPLGRWTFEDGTARDSEKTFPDGALHGAAVIRQGRLYLNGKDAYMSTPTRTLWGSKFHFRPRIGNFADPIPFFWKGEYHVFYLQGGIGAVPWQHIVSKDLVHWRELPAALVTDGAPDGPDGGHMFTGSVTEHDGTFHIFYTGHNPRNPAGLEFVRHAAGTDLIHWKKQPAFTLGPDGKHYGAHSGRNWRDPYVFWNAEANRWWMVVIASDPKTPDRAVQGLLTSDDLKTWEEQEPLPGGRGEECPDLFRIEDTWYLLGGGRYVSSASCNGPFVEPKHSVVDFPGVYAGKRMFDGHRHIWVGWAWDGSATNDAAVAGEGVLTWGGFMSMPRELYPGPNGEILCRPAREITAFHSHTAVEAPHGQAGPIEMPSDGMVECTVAVKPGASVTLSVREQEDGRAYRLTVKPSEGTIALATPASEWVRTGCSIDASKPLSLRIFLDGTMMECFVNDAYAITRRVYDLDGGKLRVTSSDPAMQVESLRVRVIPDHREPIVGK